MARNAMEAKDWDLAEHVAKQMLEHDEAYGGSHYIMALVLQNKSDRVGAHREVEAARQYWKDADSDLPELKAMDKIAGRGRDHF